MLRPPAISIPGLDEETDELFKNAVEVVVQYDRSSASLLQRRLDIGYARAARLIDQLEAAGVVGPAEGSLPREVLIRSVDDVLGAKQGKAQDEEWIPQIPPNYKVPSGLKLSKADSIPWGTSFSDVINRTEFKESKTEFPLHLGFDDDGKLKTESLFTVNNLIIAGNNLSQKENLVDTVLLTYLLRYGPSELKLILIDPTRYLDLYNGIPHLLSPVINDHGKTVSALRWAGYELDRRQKQFSEAGVRDLKAYNQKMGFTAVPSILIVAFCEFFDVETEDSWIRLTAHSERTGIHSIIIVDRTTGASLPSTIKSNIPARAVFRLTSASESRAIEVSGAEKLQPGEAIYKPNFGNTANLKAIFTPEIDVKEVVEAVKQFSSKV